MKTLLDTQAAAKPAKQPAARTSVHGIPLSTLAKIQRENAKENRWKSKLFDNLVKHGYVPT
jgi:hypothetical protein